ncbi:MAG: hypothetical protein M2R45_00233 [Verrucomicrobia subdivision 3 bacterium]|nr:hypothetical protein [Limisphaerales bacterium]MCS1412309.1 hypothetical protein [Limisphaerales bacterium]
MAEGVLPKAKSVGYGLGAVMAVGLMASWAVHAGEGVVAEPLSHPKEFLVLLLFLNGYGTSRAKKFRTGSSG